MSEGRRHSVDIPLSKTLVALRRVRSLRDPSTISMSKFTPFSDDLNWETNSFNGYSLALENGHDGGSLDNRNLLGSQTIGFDGRIDEFSNNSDFGYRFNSSKKSGRAGIRGSNLKKTKRIEESGFIRSNGDEIYEKGSFNERYGSDRRNKTSDLTWVPHSSSLVKENFDTYSEPNFELARSERGVINTTVLKRKSRHNKLIKSSAAVEDFIRSRVGSPCPSASDILMDKAGNEEVDVVGSNHRECGISCWSRSPKYRDPNLLSDSECHPLLSPERKERGNNRRELALYSDSPRSLSQKFRPRSFHELVGQHVVVQSLSSAITRGKVASIYLFHGPRGTGKTSTSRIFAAALNCLSPEEHRPCGFCRECILLFSGKGRDVKEVDATKTNRTDRIKSLLKNASHAPFSSRFKVFIIDECQLLRGETWAAFLNRLEDLPRHVVFIMITADLDMLPRSAISRCQKYHFPKIKDVDIVGRLQRICVEESLDFDKVALDFVACRSNGSLRDAETMLDQLSLLGKRITISLAYELIGIVSDDELLDLLELALSSDTSNTVRRARELMRSRVDPMQLISQLANLIMDILAYRCHSGNIEVGRNIFGRLTSEVDLQKLRHALRILSETEKQLRTSKNQTTWLTVALLQLCSEDSSLPVANDAKQCPRTEHQRDDSFCSMSLPMESLKHPVSYICKHNKSHQSEIHNDTEGKLENIWRKTIENCQSSSFKSFLQKEGKLNSVCVNKGLVIAEVEFCHPDHVLKAEKSWKLIASSLQLVLGRNVEIRINLVPVASVKKVVKVKKSPFCLLSCSGRRQEEPVSTTIDGNEQSDGSAYSSETAIKRETFVETHSPDHGYQCSPSMQQSNAKQVHNAVCFHRKETVSIRNIEGNALSTITTTACGTEQDDPPNRCKLEIDLLKETGGQGCQYLGTQELENQPSCFPKTLKFQRRLSKDPGVKSKLHCWRGPKFPLRKAWRHRRPQRRSQLVGRILPCATAKKFSGVN